MEGRIYIILKALPGITQQQVLQQRLLRQVLQQRAPVLRKQQELLLQEEACS
jgi:hypothetical protein